MKLIQSQLRHRSGLETLTYVARPKVSNDWLNDLDEELDFEASTSQAQTPLSDLSTSVHAQASQAFRTI